MSPLAKDASTGSSDRRWIRPIVSLAWRSGLGANPIVKQLRGISCHKPSGFGLGKVVSCADAVALAIQNHTNPDAVAEKHASPGGACPECGDAVEHEEGCALCRSCGYSEWG